MPSRKGKVDQFFMRYRNKIPLIYSIFKRFLSCWTYFLFPWRNMWKVKVAAGEEDRGKEMERNPGGNNFATCMLCQTCSQYIFFILEYKCLVQRLQLQTVHPLGRKLHIDRQVSFIHLVHLQTDNFCLFLCQQTDKRQTSNLHKEQTVNRLKNITWASVFHFPFETAACVYTYMHISIFCIYIYIYIGKQI